MKIRAGLTVLLTGASGGLGMPMVAALAARRVNLALVAYPGIGLEEAHTLAVRQGCRVITLALDLAKPDQCRQAVEATQREFGGVDLLINNAGVEHNSYYHELAVDKLQEVLAVNLAAPMLLTRLVLPEMLRQRRGHIVNLSSLAGKSGPAFQESYAASKAALLAFTMSLRATYRNSGVSASSICPGFVEAGIYSRLKTKGGRAAPLLLGTVPPERVASALIRAVESDRAEIIVNRYPVAPLLALMAVAPATGARIADWLGTNEFFRHAVEAEKHRQGSAGKPPHPDLPAPEKPPQ